MTDDEMDGEIELREGMELMTIDGVPLGTLVSMLVDEEEEEEPAFLTFTGHNNGDREYLLPVEAVVSQEGSTLRVSVEANDAKRLPAFHEDRDPTDAEIALAYTLSGLENPYEG
ncbi:MAG TPA: hypothetical protein VNZ52_11145 [Candidatus Thermoplasmatota archaeon]|nr:hypothetical protein [Candidatus Thermoplasmatota archaeon]